MKNIKRNKPFYKQFLRLKQNIQNRSKLFTFKKQKWIKFQQNLKKQLKKYKRFKIKDQFQISASKFASRGNSFQNKFKNNLYERKIFSLFYGKLKRKYLKTYIIKLIYIKNYNSLGLINSSYSVLKLFESRLDTVLYRANFSTSIKESSQLILNGHVLVNKINIKIKSFIIKPTDLIEIGFNKKVRTLIKQKLNRSNFWPTPPKYLLINYKTLQIIFMYTKNSNLMPVFNSYLNVNSIIAGIKKS